MIILLKNLNTLFNQLNKKVLKLDHSEYKLSDTFKGQLKATFFQYEIIFNEKTTVFTSKDSQKQYCPNQWIRIVEYGLEYYEALVQYKYHYTHVRALLEESPTPYSKDTLDLIIRNLRNTPIDKVPNDLNTKIDDYFSSPDQALLFKRFLTDYRWWHGEKTIDRGDFAATPILNLYNVVHVDNGFLLKLTKGLSEIQIPIDFSEAFIEMTNTTKVLSPLINRSYNLIFFGAPGTGKSKTLDLRRQQFFKEENYERVTFYPNYSYGQFFGTYKPKKISHATGNELSYEFVPGPFFRLWIKALVNPQENYLLIIEEINRSNAAAVFGDVFQLLDREEHGVSEYPVNLSEDALSYIAEYYPSLNISNGEIKLPNNFYIWTTMNSADQGVQPLDSAFKRRFDFEYIGINFNESIISTYQVSIPGVDYYVNWNVFRKTLNNYLLSNYRHIKEDKLIGPFFIKPTILDSSNFMNAFKNKLLMYLCEDILKTADKSKLFIVNTYSELMELCTTDGAKIFTNEFYHLLDQEMDAYNSLLTADLSPQYLQPSIINESLLEDDAPSVNSTDYFDEE